MQGKSSDTTVSRCLSDSARWYGYLCATWSLLSQTAFACSPQWGSTCGGVTVWTRLLDLHGSAFFPVTGLLASVGLAVLVVNARSWKGRSVSQRRADLLETISAVALLSIAVAAVFWLPLADDDAALLGRWYAVRLGVLLVCDTVLFWFVVRLAHRSEQQGEHET